MRRSAALALAVVALAACGGDDETAERAPAAPATATTAGAPAATTTAPASRAGERSRFVVVTSLLGRPLPGAPGCRFERSFRPDRPSASAYDGALVLRVGCRGDRRGAGGQIINRAGMKPTEISCRDANARESFCIYAPSETVGLAFIAADRATARRRIERLIEVVAPLPTGVTPLAGAAAG